MKNPHLVQEAQALTLRLHQLWDRIPHNSPYADRVVAVSERAYQRQLRREAKAGHWRAQRWLELRQAANERALQAGE